MLVYYFLGFNTANLSYTLIYKFYLFFWFTLYKNSFSNYTAFRRSHDFAFSVISVTSTHNHSIWFKTFDKNIKNILKLKFINKSLDWQAVMKWMNREVPGPASWISGHSSSFSNSGTYWSQNIMDLLFYFAM